MHPFRYPELARFIGAWFHQDFDIDGDTVRDVVGTYRGVTPAAECARLKAEIYRFLAEHERDLDAAFRNTFQPDVIAEALSGSTRAFLEEIVDALDR